MREKWISNVLSFKFFADPPLIQCLVAPPPTFVNHPWTPETFQQPENAPMFHQKIHFYSHIPSFKCFCCICQDELGNDNNWHNITSPHTDLPAKTGPLLSSPHPQPIYLGTTSNALTNNNSCKKAQAHHKQLYTWHVCSHRNTHSYLVSCKTLHYSESF